MNVIHSVFSLVLKFRSQLISQPWGPAGGPRGPEHPNFALMQQSYSAFKYYSHFLFKGDAPWGRGGLGRAPQFKSINSLALSFLHSPTLTSIHDHRKNHSLD